MCLSASLSDGCSRPWNGCLQAASSSYVASWVSNAWCLMDGQSRPRLKNHRWTINTYLQMRVAAIVLFSHSASVAAPVFLCTVQPGWPRPNLTSNAIKTRKNATPTFWHEMYLCISSPLPCFLPRGNICPNPHGHTRITQTASSFHHYLHVRQGLPVTDYTAPAFSQSQASDYTRRPIRGTA